MSSRQLRKLQQQRELEAQAKLAAQEEEEEESENEIIAPSKPKASLFASFAALQDEEEPEEEPEEATIEDSKPLDDPAPASTNKSKKSKKKKKKKAKNNVKEEVTQEKIEEKGDEIDVALRKLAMEQPSSTTLQNTRQAADPAFERVCELLGINTIHLKVGTEMRNLFGKDVMDNHDDAGGAVPRTRGSRRQRNAQQQVDLETALKGRHPPGKGLPELTLRRNIFVQGKDDWPRASATLKLETSKGEGQHDEIYGRFIHDKAYQDLQTNFHAFVEMGDPQNLIGLLQRNPYHISLLIQVSKIAKDQSDHSLSSDLLERALFTFARATNSIFATKISQGKMRLAFGRPENRELWLAGYQYIKSLIMKGTYRTALEWAKLLLSFDHVQDPYCMRLMIHHLALRCSEFQWLLDLYDSDFPNTWSPAGLRRSKAESHLTPSLAFAALQLRDGVKARKLLTESMQQVPWLYTRLFKEINLDAPPSIWGIQARTDAETLFSEICVLQTKDLWNTPEATALLMEIAHTIKEVKVDDLPKLPNEEMTLDVVRFVYLDNNPALMRLVPSQLLHRENNSDADPLPPYENIYSYETQRRWIERGATGQPGLGGDFMNPLAAIARLIPGFRAIPRAEVPPNHEDGDQDINADELRRGLEEVVRGTGPSPARERGEQRMPRSVAQTLLDMLGWGRNDDDDSEEEYENAELGDDTDADEDALPEVRPREEDGDDDQEAGPGPARR